MEDHHDRYGTTSARSPATTRRDFLKWAGAASATLTMPGLLRQAMGEGAPGKAKPNVLFILADDMRPDCIAALGNEHIKTPNLDKLVHRGTSFSRVYVMGSFIGAVCTPSRSMILSGRSLYHLPPPAGKNRQPYTTWPKAMSAGGYETFHLGKEGNSFKPGMEAFDTVLYTNQIGAEKHDVSAQKCADRMIQFLSSRKADRPFFIYWAPPVPHDPRIAPKEFMDMYDPAKIPLPPSYMPVHPFDNGEMTVRDEKLAPWPRTEAVVKRHLADDYACITYFDFHIGRVVDALQKAGQLDNTIVIFAADNGLSLGDHGLMGKQNLYEYGGMHVPLVFAGPGVPRGKSDAFVYLFDVYPTVCELTGTAIPAAVEAKSLVPALTGEDSKLRPYMFTAYRDVQRAIRDDRWKLIRYPHVNKTQLYDLRSDPHEMNDLSGKPEHADKLQEMMALLEKAQREYDDSCPLTVANPQDPQWSPEGGGRRGNRQKRKAQ